MTTDATNTSHDIYTRITDQIVAELEKGNLVWRKPWSSEHLAGQVTRPLRHNDVPYSGINTIVLWATAASRGYSSPYWMTYKQATDLKAQVRKGEKGTSVVYADKMVKEETDDDGNTEQRRIPYLKVYTVFNADQIEGLGEGFHPQPKIIREEDIPQRNAELERFFAATKAEIETGTKAAYYESRDRIEMPPIHSFYEVSDYYATLAHELTHWTKHPSRLNRNFGRKRWGDEGYAMEELVAELGACFLAADLGFAPASLGDSAAYIQSWLKALKDDKRLIFSAAGYAQRAVEYCGLLMVD